MKKEYINPTLFVENIKVDDVILVSTINEDHNMGNSSSYDDEF